MSAQAQDSAIPDEPSYLLRMERMLANENQCVLLRGDGQFHFEGEVRDSMQIFEGTVSPADLQKVEHLVNSDEILQLSQEKIAAPLIGFPDELFVSVARPGHWQNLRFPTPDTRKPFRESLDPLLKWMDGLHNQKHVTLSEDAGRRNCLPPGNIEFSTRPAASENSQSAPRAPQPANRSSESPTSLPPAFAMRMLESRFQGGQLEKSCLIVYATGRYHREQRTQRAGEPSVTTRIFEGSLQPAQLQQLHAVLNDPELQQRAFKQPPSTLAVQELDYVTLTIARGAQNQDLNFWRFFGAFRTGTARMPNADDNGMKHLKPLKQWLKPLEDSPPAPLDAMPNNCQAATPQP